LTVENNHGNINIIMLVNKAYKFRLYPTEKQKEQLSKFFGCSRFIWNKNVEVFNSYDKENNPQPEFKSSTEYKKEFEFLNEVSAAVLQQKEIDFKEYKKQFFNKSRKKNVVDLSLKVRKINKPLDFLIKSLKL